jgi:hypothetical protein
VKVKILGISGTRYPAKEKVPEFLCGVLATGIVEQGRKRE